MYYCEILHSFSLIKFYIMIVNVVEFRSIDNTMPFYYQISQVYNDDGSFDCYKLRLLYRNGVDPDVLCPGCLCSTNYQILTDYVDFLSDVFPFIKSALIIEINKSLIL